MNVRLPFFSANKSAALLTIVVAALTVILNLLPFIPNFIGLYMLQSSMSTLENVKKNTEEFATSIDNLRYAAKLLPRDSLVLRHLAGVYQSVGRHDEAIIALEQAVDRAPQSLIVRTELLLAYYAAGQYDAAASLEHELGYTPERLIELGDAYLEKGDHRQALLWYDIALRRQPLLAKTLAFRRLIATIPTSDLRAMELLSEVRDLLPHLEVPRIDGRNVGLAGESLVWVSKGKYGVPLDHPYESDISDGVFWTNGQATLIVEVEQTFDYLVRFTVRNSYPPPVEMSFGVNGLAVLHVSLTAGDNSFSAVELPITLVPPLMRLDVWFLNNGTIQGEDRDAVIRWIDLEPIHSDDT